MKPIRIDIDGQEVEVLAAKSASGQLWIHLDGETFTYEGAQSRSRSGKASTAKPNEIIAPMPGKIVKIQVASGEKVQAGQVLVVMEAMKMEYTLKAQADAVVDKVLANTADQVTLGQLLVKLIV